ncbi:hypothetical protein FH5T_19160 [Draconibacterium orientale]|uniref:Uncharacterized protein n=1 Tax=Draconibacterium orientale TaxID=1168034 RepID=A0ABM5QFT2_9BACT|nr:hypothetical protein FH5T_19160 [Draconibacterium orientale]
MDFWPKVIFGFQRHWLNYPENERNMNVLERWRGKWQVASGRINTTIRRFCNSVNSKKRKKTERSVKWRVLKK